MSPLKCARLITNFNASAQCGGFGGMENYPSIKDQPKFERLASVGWLTNLKIKRGFIFISMIIR